MEKQIYLSSKKKKELIETFKVTRQTLWYALTFKRDSKIAKVLRAAAMQRGGVLIDFETGDKVDADYVFDTYFTYTPRHQMFQFFGARVVMRIDIATNLTTIEVDGKVIKKIEDTKLRMIKEIQEEAQDIAETLKN